MWAKLSSQKTLFLVYSLLFLVGYSISISKTSAKMKTKDTAIEWVPEKIYNSTNFQSGLVDPEGYLNNFDSKPKIYDLIDELKKVKNIDATVVLISKISDKYSLGGSKKDIGRFVDELSKYLVRSNRDSDSHSLIMLFSVTDRQMQMRTGSEVKKVLDNRAVAKILRSLKKELKRGDYGAAATKVLHDVIDKLNGADGSVLASIFALSMILGILWCICYSMVGIAGSETLKSNYADSTPDSEAERKLNKIKEITERNVGKKDFLEKSCVICLEDFKQESLNKMGETNRKETPEAEGLEIEVANEKTHDKINHNHENENNELNKENLKEIKRVSNTLPPTCINHTVIVVKDEHQQNKNDDEKPLITKPETEHDKIENKNIFEIAKLDCGHTFHSKCITEWMEKQNKCPVCRSLIDANSNEASDSKPLQQGLVEIQSDIHPSLSNYNFSYGPLFLWSVPHSAPEYHYQGGNDGGNLMGGGMFDGGWNLAGGADDLW